MLDGVTHPALIIQTGIADLLTSDPERAKGGKVPYAVMVGAERPDSYRDGNIIFAELLYSC